MLLDEEGLSAVFARHARHGEATRRAVRGWGLEVLCQNEAEYSNALTAVLMPDGFDADRLRETILDAYDMSLGTGLGKVKGRMFRIGHLGECNDLTLMAALSGCEMGLKLSGVALKGSGVTAAMDYLTSHVAKPALKAAA
jgi:alanine-glyoxylate transaminase/serine-glyoxylate transaminase/serine-pyruvate transaminase